LYEVGEGVTRDYVKAVDYYRKASDQGYVVAVYNLAVMWQNGTGLEADVAKAVELYVIAADAGLAAAQFNVGVILGDEQAPDYDAEKARYWLNKASEQGHVQARIELESQRAKTD
jgi:TPR repeat protein